MVGQKSIIHSSIPAKYCSEVMKDEVGQEFIIHSSIPAIHCSEVRKEGVGHEFIIHSSIPAIHCSEVRGGRSKVHNSLKFRLYIAQK